MNDRKFWMQVRQALLMLVDVIEQRLTIAPRTSQLRRAEKKRKEPIG